MNLHTAFRRALVCAGLVALLAPVAAQAGGRPDGLTPPRDRGGLMFATDTGGNLVSFRGGLGRLNFESVKPITAAGRGVAARHRLPPGHRRGVFLALDSSPPPVPTEAVTFTQVAPGVGVEGELIAHTWGVEVNLVATGLEDGQRYDAWLVRRDGTQVSAGSFVGVSARPVVCKLNDAVLLEDAQTFVVTLPDGEVVMEAPLLSV
jgi:hypothetical protein